MEKAVKDFGWPSSMIHAVDDNGDLWGHFETRFRGTWIFINQDGRLLHRSVGHIPKDELKGRLDELVAN